MSTPEHDRAKDILRGYADSEIIGFVNGSTTPWTRTNHGTETIGARFDRTVLRPTLPASISTIVAAGKKAGFKDDYNYGVRGHLAWALAKKYVERQIKRKR